MTRTLEMGENDMIDFDKPVKTRDGNEVRILCTDAPSTVGYPVIGYVIEPDGSISTRSWGLDGRWLETNEHFFDLVNVKEKKVGWVNIYKNNFYNELEKDRTCGYLYKHYGDAKYTGEMRKNYVATVKVEWEE